MTFANAKRLIDTAFNWGVPQLQWVGGEAFVNKDFPKIVEYAQSLGLVQNIITNGIIPGVRPKKFMNTLRAFSTIQVSANAVGDSYNIIVGKSVYEKFVQSVKLINDSCGNVWLSCVVTRKNARSLNQIVSLGELVGARGITFGILAKQGRAVANAMNYFECLNWARESLNSVLTSDGPAIEIDCHFDPTMSRLQKAQSVEKRHGGYEGHSILFINKDGDIYPFPLLEMNSLKLGNAFIDDLRQLWFSSELLTSLRAAADPLLCEGCDSDCSFRSRSLRYLWTGSFSGKLPCYRFDFKK
jgi:MoaA/NifB/PqqE/SkfB family radical SAM enzyme